MRRLLLVLGLLVLSLTPAASAGGGDVPGWTPVSCGCEHALSVDLVDTDRGFLGTDSGVSRTDDGGWTWKPLAFPVSGQVERVSFADRDNGAVVGAFEGVVVTHDGGASWTQYRPWVGRSLDVVTLPDRWFALAESGLYTSTDGGRVWTKLHGAFPPAATFTRMSWYDPSNGVITNGTNAFTTTDGGRSFATVPTLAVFTFDAISLGADEAVVAGQQSVHSGRPWVGHIGGDRHTPYVLASRGVADEQVHGLARSGSTFYAAGVEGLLARSTDAGGTWSYEATPPSYERSALYDVDTLDADHAVVAVWSGRVLLRHAPRLHDVTTTPHRGLGLGLLGLTVGVGGAAAWALTTGRPKGIAYGLIGATLAVGAPGAFLTLDTRTCHPGGCGGMVTATGGDEGGFVAPPTASPTPSPTPSPTASPTPSATASATPSRTPLGAFTATLSKSPSCDANGGAHPGRLTLRNTTIAPVFWSVTAREKVTDPTTQQQVPWAALSPTHGTLAGGTMTFVDVLPDDSLCKPGQPGTTEHVNVHRATQTIVVPVKVTPQS